MQNPPLLAESSALDVGSRIPASNAVNQSRRRIRIDQGVNTSIEQMSGGGFSFSFQHQRSSVCVLSQWNVMTHSHGAFITSYPEHGLCPDNEAQIISLTPTGHQRCVCLFENIGCPANPGYGLT